jgi:hypothetical protein
MMKKGMMYQAGGAVKSPMPAERKRRVMEGGPKGVPVMTPEQRRQARSMMTEEERREADAPLTARELEGMSSRYKKGGMVMGDKPEASISTSEERDATGYAGGMGRYERSALKNMNKEAEDRARLNRKLLKQNTAEMEQSGGYSKFKKGGMVKKAAGGMVKKKAGGVVKKAKGGMIGRGCK